MSVWVCGVSTDCAIRVLREKDTLGVRKFIRTGLITGSDLCLSYLQLFFALFFKYIDTIYLRKLIPGPASDLHLFPNYQYPNCIYRLDYMCMYLFPLDEMLVNRNSGSYVFL